MGQEVFDDGMVFCLVLLIGTSCSTYKNKTSQAETLKNLLQEIRQAENQPLPIDNREIIKGYEGNRPHTTCRMTARGRRRFLDYLAVLEKVVRDAAEAAGDHPKAVDPHPKLRPA